MSQRARVGSIASERAVLQGLDKRKAHLHTFLVEHPLLMLEIGFRPALDASQPYGFDVQRTLPTDRWLRKKLRTLDPTLLQDLLHVTVHALQAEIPGLGTTIAVDVTHIYAWVKQNNVRDYVTERYNPALS